MNSWVIVRRGTGHAPDEPIAVLDAEHQAAAEQLRDQLGEGHYVYPVPVVEPGRVRVVATWMCRVRVVDGAAPEVGEPQQLAGAVALVPVDERPPWAERVVPDVEAERLDAMLEGPRTRYATAYGYTPEGARALARAEAQRLAGG